MPPRPPLFRRGFTLSPRPVLALDLGGTQIRSAVVLPDGSRAVRFASETPVGGDPEIVLEACAEALAQARAAAPRDVGSRIVGIGLSSPGPVDPWSGIVVEPPNLGREFENVPLAARMEEALGLPAYLDRDTNVAALGEQAFGAAAGCDDFLYITVSTGVGGAVVSGGRLLHGPDGTAGEVGHLTVELDGPRCGCGGVGHLEAIASGIALAREARIAADTGVSPFLAERGASDGFDELSAKDVADGETAGDEVCARLMERARAAFAAACVGLVNLFNPERIVVGGSIAEHQGDRLLGPARETVALEAFRTPRARVQIVPAALGGDVSLAGALPLVAARLGDPAWRRGRDPIPIPMGA